MQVDFYILNSTPQDRLGFACRLLEKAYTGGHQIYVHTSDQKAAERFDDLLWTFRDDSFVAHELFRTAAKARVAPVLIGWLEPPVEPREIVLNLDTRVAESFFSFERVLEVVDQNPDQLAASRQRYKHYRSRDIEPRSHKL